MLKTKEMCQLMPIKEDFWQYKQRFIFGIKFVGFQDFDLSFGVFEDSNISKRYPIKKLISEIDYLIMHYKGRVTTYK